MGKCVFWYLFFFVHLSVFWPFDLAIVSQKRCNGIMDVNFYLFIVYQMYQYTVSDINIGTIFFKEVENSRPIFPCRATFVRKNHQICTQETFCDIK